MAVTPANFAAFSPEAATPSRRPSRIGAWGGMGAGQFWSALFYFNLYRIASVVVFAVACVAPSRPLVGGEDPGLFVTASSVYFLIAVATAVAIHLRRPSVPLLLGAVVVVDVVYICTATFASGGVHSGLGMMLLVTLAAAGLIARGRIVLFYASIAAVGLLVEEVYQYLNANAGAAEFLGTGVLSMACFAVSGLAYSLAQYASETERIATQRGVDLANLGQVNQLIIDDLDSAVVVCDETGQIVQYNRATQGLLGPLPLAPEHTNLATYCAELDSLRLEWRSQPGTKFRTMRSPVSGAELRVRQVVLGEPQPRATLMFIEDISQERAQARQIKLAALGRLTANIAHEIRNPLSAISHAAELMQEEGAAGDSMPMLLRIIRDNSNRLDRMVREVLQLNRRDRAQPENIDVRSFLETYVEDFCHSEKAQREVFSIEVDGPRQISFDRNHLQQVLWNLTRNGYRHCRKQTGSIRFCINRSLFPNMVQLDVIDDGPGVSVDVQGQLFEPFFTTDSQGTGLGLYIARELGEANGATLDYVEVAPGGQFRLLIKAAA